MQVVLIISKWYTNKLDITNNNIPKSGHPVKENRQISRSVSKSYIDRSMDT